mgnify:FL=1
MCVRTHMLFNSYLMYVNHFNTFLMSEACLGAYTLLYMPLHYICLFAHEHGDGLEAQIVFR